VILEEERGTEKQRWKERRTGRESRGKEKKK
jgi:hypothetical protein